MRSLSLRGGAAGGLSRSLSPWWDRMGRALSGAPRRSSRMGWTSLAPAPGWQPSRRHYTVQTSPLAAPQSRPRKNTAAPPRRGASRAAKEPASGRGEAAPPARRGPRPKTAAVDKTKAAPTPGRAAGAVVRIRCGDVIDEWHRLVRLSAASALQDMEGGGAPAGATGPASPLPFGKLPERISLPEVTLAERTAMLSILRKQPGDFPNLCTLFCVPQGSTEAPCPTVDLQLGSQTTAATALHEEDVIVLLGVWRVLEQVSQHSAHMATVGEQLGMALCSEVTRVWRAGEAWRRPREVVRMALRVFLEMRRRQLSQRSAPRPAEAVEGVGTATAAPRPRQRTANKNAQRQREAMLSLFLDTTAQPISDAVVADVSRRGSAPAADASLGHVVEGLAQWGLLLMSADVAESVGRAGSHACSSAWRRLATTLGESIEADMARAARAPPPTSSHLMEDVLDALLISQELEMVLRSSHRLRLHAHACTLLLEVCHRGATDPATFEDICRPMVAVRLEALRIRTSSVYSQVCTSVFTAGELFARGAPSRLPRLLDALETERRAALGAEGVSAAHLPGRPVLCGAAAQTCYALLTAGFAPEAVLSSSLCLSLPVRDLVDVTQAATLFSSSFATTALPGRLRGRLQEHALACMDRGGRRLASARRSTTRPSSLSAWLAVDRRAGETRGPAATEATEAEEAVAHALYVAVHLLVGALVRGDGAMVVEFLRPLFPLLQTLGSTRFLVQCLEQLTQRTRTALDRVGALEIGATRYVVSEQRPPTRLAHTSKAMETSLTELIALFLPRVSESVLGALEAPSPAHRGAAAADAPPTEDLSRLLLCLSADAITCGMTMATVNQLTYLHTAVLKSRGGTREGVEDDAKSAFHAVERLDQFVTEVERRAFHVRRHPDSAGLRTGSIALNDVVAVHLNATAETAAAFIRVYHIGGRPAPMRQRNYILSVVHLLFRVSTHYPVEAEPATLRVFRTDLLDPALCHVIQSATAGTEGGAVLPLTVLTETAVVLCVRRTIHHVSLDLFRGLAGSVTAYVESRAQEAPGQEDTVTGTLAMLLLRSAAAVCVRADEVLTGLFLQMLAALEGYLTVPQTIRVLQELREQDVPCDAAPVRRMLERLVGTLPAAAPAVALAALAVLAPFQAAAAGVEVPYAALLGRLTAAAALEHYTLGECGVLVGMVASLQTSPPGARLSPETRRSLAVVPGALAARVLRAAPLCPHGDVPPLVRGYAAVAEGPVREAVLRGFIARAIRVCPSLSPEEVVQCVEAYCLAGIYHANLFGVLLSRVADVRQRFSLELSVRLLRCGTRSGHRRVQTACVTAAQPVFVAHVRHLLQCDPDLLTSVTSTSVTILTCLRDCFPADPIGAAVLENIARYHHTAGLAVTRAALALTIARGGSDYDVLRVLAEHSTGKLFPLTGPRDFADLTYLLVVCGVRSGAFFDSVRRRFSQIASTADGYALAHLASALQRACVDVDAELLSAYEPRILELVRAFKGTATGAARPSRHARTPAVPPPFTTSEVATLLKMLHTVSRHLQAQATPLVDALLGFLLLFWKHSGGGGKLAVPEVYATDLEVILRSCLEKASTPKAHAPLVQYSADCMEKLIQEPEDAAREAVMAVQDAMLASSPVGHDATVKEDPTRRETTSAEWRDDLLLMVNLANYFVRLGAANHPAVHSLFALLYEKRGALLQRHLLLETTSQTVRLAGKSVHPTLYKVIVERNVL